MGWIQWFTAYWNTGLHLVEIYSDFVRISSELVEISSELVEISSELVSRISELLIISAFRICRKSVVKTQTLPRVGTTG